jgi:squalene synthase HpnC
MMELKQAYQYCHKIAKQHYENFPVASWVLPRRLRQAITVIYAFARSADDLADEGDVTEEQRLQALARYETELQNIANGKPLQEPIFIALRDVIRVHSLPMEPFFDLLSAFKQDVTKKRYQDAGEMMDYCRRSANPIGRLLLHLYGKATPRNIALSDGICSALQIVNFLQDIQQDYRENGRIYLPIEDMNKYHVTELHIRQRLNEYNVKQLLDFEIERARKILKAGAPLATILGGRVGFELRLIIYGGTRILYRLHEQKQDYFSRPRLRLTDKAWIAWRSMFPK